jgi:DNA-directed RNA polymerase subunit RPC12/RpoP
VLAEGSRIVPMESQTIDSRIRFEISIAIARLGADDALLSRVPSLSAAQLVAQLKALGALPMLLGIVSSWEQNVSDDETLERLRTWNKESYYQIRRTACSHCKNQIVLIPTMEEMQMDKHRCPTCGKDFLTAEAGSTSITIERSFT